MWSFRFVGVIPEMFTFLLKQITDHAYSDFKKNLFNKTR